MLTRAEPDGRITWASPSATAVTGHAPAEMVGRRIVELAHPDDAAHVEQMMRVASEPHMPPIEAIFRLVHKSGEHVWVHARFQGVTDSASGQFKELVTSSRPLYLRVRNAGAEAEAVRLSRPDRH